MRHSTNYHHHQGQFRPPHNSPAPRPPFYQSPPFRATTPFPDFPVHADPTSLTKRRRLDANQFAPFHPSHPFPSGGPGNSYASDRHPYGDHFQVPHIQNNNLFNAIPYSSPNLHMYPPPGQSSTLPLVSLRSPVSSPSLVKNPGLYQHVHSEAFHHPSTGPSISFCQPVRHATEVGIYDTPSASSKKLNREFNGEQCPRPSPSFCQPDKHAVGVGICNNPCPSPKKLDPESNVEHCSTPISRTYDGVGTNSSALNTRNQSLQYNIKQTSTPSVEQCKGLEANTSTEVFQKRKKKQNKRKGKQEAEHYYSKAMTNDPWYGLEPIVGNILEPLGGTWLWLPKSVTAENQKHSVRGSLVTPEICLTEIFEDAFEEAASHTVVSLSTP